MWLPGTRWISQPADTYLNAALGRQAFSAKRVAFVDQFVAGAKNWAVTDETDALTTARLTYPAGNFGGVVLATTSTASRSCRMLLGDRNTRYQTHFPSTKPWYIGFKGKIGAIAANAQAFLNFIKPDVTTSFGYLGYLSGLNGDRFAYFNAAGVVQIDSGVAADTNAHILELESNGSNLVTLRLDGVVKGTSATIPSDATVRFESNNGATAADRTFEINWVALAYDVDSDG